MIKYFALCVLMALPISSALAEDISTRFGQVVLKEGPNANTLNLSLNGAKITSLETNSLNGFGDLFQVGGVDVVTINTLAGGGCGSYYFLSVKSRSVAILSPSFSSCGEIVIKQSGNSLTTKSMDNQGKNKKSIAFTDGVLTENGKKLR